MRKLKNLWINLGQRRKIIRQAAIEHLLNKGAAGDTKEFRAWKYEARTFSTKHNYWWYHQRDRIDGLGWPGQNQHSEIKFVDTVRLWCGQQSFFLSISRVTRVSQNNEHTTPKMFTHHRAYEITLKSWERQRELSKKGGGKSSVYQHLSESYWVTRLLYLLLANFLINSFYHVMTQKFWKWCLTNQVNY